MTRNKDTEPTRFIGLPDWTQVSIEMLKEHFSFPNDEHTIRYILTLGIESVNILKSLNVQPGIYDNFVRVTDDFQLVAADKNSQGHSDRKMLWGYETRSVIQHVKKPGFLHMPKSISVKDIYPLLSTGLLTQFIILIGDTEPGTYGKFQVEESGHIHWK
jgi:hypothetical protein